MLSTRVKVMDISPPQTVPDSVTLRSEVPGWGIWLSDAQRWWGYRTAEAPLTIQQLRAGCVLIVQADSLDELLAEIQNAIDRADRASGGPL